MKLKKYRKKPVVIEAIQYNGENCEELEEFTGIRMFHFWEDDAIEIPTLEGNHKCSVNDFVIKGVKGEFYPCKPDIFEATYEEVIDEINEK